MDAVAFIDPAVIDFINTNLVPIRVPADDPELGPRYTIKWTPTLLMVDGDGVEQYRTLGFYPPAELIPSLLLGIGKTRFNLPDRPAACACFAQILADYPMPELGIYALLPSNRHVPYRVRALMDFLAAGLAA